jgi:protein-disulfide isomerase
MRASHIGLVTSALLVTAAACADGDARPADTTTGVPAATSAATVPAGDSSTRAQPVPAGARRVVLGDVDLTGVGYDAGSVNAPVVMIDFSDFGCPFCAQFTRETYPVIEREYIRTGKVFFKYVPFIVGMFPHSEEATRAVECAGEQGRFWPMADQVYDAQREWKGSSDPRPSLMRAAAAAGADAAKLSACYADGHTDARTRHATDVADRLGVRVTPSFVIDGRPVEGALPLPEFRKVIEAALASASHPR